MNTKSYKGLTLSPASYLGDDTPGYWYPLVVVDGPKLYGAVNVALRPSNTLTEAQANEQAMQAAVRRIDQGNL
jgi:hypothetical protein